MDWYIKFLKVDALHGFPPSIPSKQELPLRYRPSSATKSSTSELLKFKTKMKLSLRGSTLIRYFPPEEN